MNRYSSTVAMLFITAATAGLAGCGDSPTKQIAPSHNTVTTGPPATVETRHDDHAHPSEGPHGGSLIELGSEEYHAELVHNEAADTVTFYLLDSAAKAGVAIEAKDLTVNLKHEGKAAQFKIAASPDSSDEGGKSSRFVSADPELAEELDHEHAEGQLVVTINGKQFRGDIRHDHEGHEHEGHEHGSEKTP